MDKGQGHNTSALFLVRLWVDEAHQENAEWRGRLIHVLSGEARDFSDWQTLEALMFEMTPIMRSGPYQPSKLEAQDGRE